MDNEQATTRFRSSRLANERGGKNKKPQKIRVQRNHIKSVIGFYQSYW